MMSEANTYHTNWLLEKELKEDWKLWQAKAHPEDQMPFIEYAEDQGTYKGWTVKVVSSSSICFKSESQKPHNETK
tara:strand:- start:99 stop:323 length:225 start_codon:yes stop_codon:yes gene_type:complete